MSGKPTIIYGLIDPRNQQLRYIGKTILASPKRRLFTHIWRARTAPHKRHSMAWLLNLEREGLAPEIVILEEVAPGGDWIEAEQFWIAYFRMIGADLCNHTAGGEGQTGYKQPPELIAKRIRRGPEHHSTGKPLSEKTKALLRAANKKKRLDPEWLAWFEARRKAGITEEIKAKTIANLHMAMSNPELRAQANKKKSLIMKSPEHRAAVSLHSSKLWREKRDQIIAAQNAGKGEGWKRRQAELGRFRMSNPNHPLRTAARARRKLDDESVATIRRRAAQGERSTVLAREYGVDSSTISHIKSGRDR